MSHALTTGDVARCCGVSPQTVVKWCQAGKLRFWRVQAQPEPKQPGHRRFRMEDVIRFANNHGFKVSPPGKLVALLVGFPAHTRAAAESPLASTGHTIVHAPTLLQAGVLAAKLTPSLIAVHHEADVFRQIQPGDVSFLRDQLGKPELYWILPEDVSGDEALAKAGWICTKLPLNP